MYRIKHNTIYFLLAVCVALPGYAADRIELDETEIKGASELPKVLYIVPWKKLDPDDKPVKLQSMVDEIMTPVDKEILRRQVNFSEAMKPAPVASTEAK